MAVVQAKARTRASEAISRRDLLRGGVGCYEESDFVHVDVGPVRTW